MGDKFVWGTIIGTLLLLGAIVYFGSSSSPTIAQPKDIKEAELIRDHSPQKGPENAKITLVEFADFQCPACASTQPELEKLIEYYGDDIRFIFRNLPLNTHPHADLAARVAIAADNQNKFFEMSSLLYEKQREWSTKLDPKKTLIKYAEELGLDTDQVNKDISSTETTDIISTDLGDVQALGLTGTPTIYINGERFTGPASFDAIKAYIDAL